MKLFKSAVVALALALSLGSFSTTAVACEDGRTCVGPQEGINMVLGHIAAAMVAVEAKEGQHEILEHIRKAKNASKEINANDVVDRNRMKANGFLKKARSAIKKGDLQTGEDHLGEAEKRFSALSGML